MKWIDDTVSSVIPPIDLEKKPTVGTLYAGSPKILSR
jgi:hypothetical protein